MNMINLLLQNSSNLVFLAVIIVMVVMQHRERKDLYDRIMSNNIHEYMLKKSVDKQRKPEIESGVTVPMVDEMTGRIIHPSELKNLEDI